MHSFVRHALLSSALVVVPGGMFAAAALADETISIVGTLNGGGIECPTMQGDDGTLYSLTPRQAIGLVAAGVRIRVEGSLAEMSFCQEGTTIEITKVEPAE